MNNIYITQGDSATLTFLVKDTNGVVQKLQEGDIVTFTVRKTPHHAEVILRKEISSFYKGTAEVIFTPTDTQALQPRDYKYDVQVKFADGRVKTLIKPSRFTIGGSVSNE